MCLSLTVATLHGSIRANRMNMEAPGRPWFDFRGLPNGVHLYGVGGRLRAYLSTSRLTIHCMTLVRRLKLFIFPYLRLIISYTLGKSQIVMIPRKRSESFPDLVINAASNLLPLYSYS
jgi:hypothetical protein